MVSNTSRCEVMHTHCLHLLASFCLLSTYRKLPSKGQSPDHVRSTKALHAEVVSPFSTCAHYPRRHVDAAGEYYLDEDVCASR